jgi:hypothetical protein
MPASKFDAATCASIAERVRVGVSLADAARAESVDPRTVRGWIQRGRQELKGDYTDFAVAVEAARAEAEEAASAPMTEPQVREVLEDQIRGGSLRALEVWFREYGREEPPAEPSGIDALDSETSPIIAFKIPDFSMTGHRTPREAWEAANALHNYHLGVRVDRKVEFRPQPSVPMFRVGAWGGAEFNDASKNSVEDIYNKSIVKGTGPDGTPITVNRRAPLRRADPQPTNGSFATSTTGWTATVGSLTRDTAVFASSPASGRITTSGDIALVRTSSWTEPLRAGRTYELRLRLRRTAHLSSGSVFVSAGPSSFFIPVSDISTSAFVEFSLTLPGTGVATEVLIYNEGVASNQDILYVDDVELWEGSTVVDRRDFTRAHVTSMSQAIIPEIGEQIADAFLSTHKRAPLKGDISIKGRDGVRRYLGDASVHPSELLLHCGELIHLSDEIDPDTGHLGRDAPIDAVTWSEDDDTAAISLDAQRDNLAAVIARYDLVAGQGG